MTTKQFLLSLSDDTIKQAKISISNNNYSINDTVGLQYAILFGNSLILDTDGFDFVISEGDFNELFTNVIDHYAEYYIHENDESVFRNYFYNFNRIDKINTFLE